MTLWQHFDKNEISLIILNVLAYFALFLLRKKFPPQIRNVALMWGLAIGILFDFTIGGGLIDFYKVNDSNRYEGADVLYYILYAPFGYFFFYFYDALKIDKKTFLFYVLAWSFVGLAAQWLFNILDIITLQKGYRLAYSFPVFLLTQTVTGIYFEMIRRRSGQPAGGRLATP